MADESRHTKPLSKNCRYRVTGVITDSVTEEQGYVLTPIAEYPGRDIEVGDVFEPVGFEPKGTV
jgi:hypothetical protein